VPIPEKDHFFDRIHPDHVDEVNIPFFSPAFPLRDLTGHESIERELARHESFLTGLGRRLPEKLSSLGRMVLSKGRVNLGMFAVEDKV